MILDAGTGIRTPRARAERQARIQILLTHLHLDHIQGLMFFPLLLPRRVRDHDLGTRIAGGLTRGPGRALHLGPALAGRGSRALARSRFVTRRRVSGSSAGQRSGPRRSPTAARRSAIGSATARPPSPTFPTMSRLSGAPSRARSEWISGFDLARDADLLIHDCQYTDDEYPDHVGWGHSRLTDTLTFARRVEARRLLLFITTRCTPTSSSTGSRPPRSAPGVSSAGSQRSSSWRWRARSSRSRPLRRRLSPERRRFRPPVQVGEAKVSTSG